MRREYITGNNNTKEEESKSPSLEYNKSCQLSLKEKFQQL